MGLPEKIKSNVHQALHPIDVIYQDFLPSPPLRNYVKCYHLRHFLFADAKTMPVKPYAPRPDQQLAFYPRGHELVEHVASHKRMQRPRSMITGQYTERTNRHLSGPDFLVLLVDFQPGVLYRITGISFYELTNTFVDAEAIFSPDIRLVNERLNSTGDYREMIGIVELFLRKVVGGWRRPNWLPYNAETSQTCHPLLSSRLNLTHSATKDMPMLSA